MKMEVMLISLYVLSTEGKRACKTCLESYIETKFPPKWTIGSLTVRRRIAYLEKNNLGTYDKSHVCSFCGKRRSLVIGLEPITIKYISLCMKSYKANKQWRLFEERVNLIGQKQLLYYYMLFVTYMAKKGIGFVETGRYTAAEMGIDYNKMLISLNRLERLALFVKETAQFNKHYCGNEITNKFVLYTKQKGEKK